MKFVLEIELGNDAMQNGLDVLQALRQSFRRNQGLEHTISEIDEGVLIDENENTVGKWEVSV